MRTLKLAVLSAALVTTISLAPALNQAAAAQVSIGINLGSEPSCPFGYYDYAPYNCAPDGYYGPEWFAGGRFVGAGKWFRGPANFHGSVNNHFDPQHGYKGPAPQHGPAQAPHAHFAANEDRDGHGHASPHGSPHGR
jgi:hypothetical protein